MSSIFVAKSPTAAGLVLPAVQAVRCRNNDCDALDPRLLRQRDVPPSPPQPFSQLAALLDSPGDPDDGWMDEPLPPA